MKTTSKTEDVQIKVREILDAYRRDRTDLVAILCRVQEKWRKISPDVIAQISEELDIPLVHVAGAATFYHFLTESHAGHYTVYVNTCATAELSGCGELIHAFETELGIPFGSNTPDQLIGLRKTSCIGMSDQEPAILVNGTVFTRMTPLRVKELVSGIRAMTPVEELCKRMNAETQSVVCAQGPVFFSDYRMGSGLERALTLDSLDIIEMIKESGLRGRGGAGFPTGIKWAACRAADSEVRYVICNADEGEPGTFKDRVLLSELPELIFEGMVIAGYAIEAKEGFLYLRHEYTYLRKRLEEVLAAMRSKNLLGRRILGTRFSFDIRIKEGAGAYICGEESALIESAEGKRGQPRNRPPFPVTAGYLHRPTLVNNPETFGCAVKIVLNGSKWFRKMGTSDSPGVKLLSISGDCKRPGVYELEWGKSVGEVLQLCGADNVQAVQVGGPSGICISPAEFDRKLCYSDLPTGGAFTIFSQDRDLLSVIQNHMEFFRDESCGFCVPCRAGNTLMVKELKKIRDGNGTQTDLDGIRELGVLVRTASRCGLGHTSPNPVLTTLDKFKDVYSKMIRKEESE